MVREGCCKRPLRGFLHWFYVCRLYFSQTTYLRIGLPLSFYLYPITTSQSQKVWCGDQRRGLRAGLQHCYTLQQDTQKQRAAGQALFRRTLSTPYSTAFNGLPPTPLPSLVSTFRFTYSLHHEKVMTCRPYGRCLRYPRASL